MRNINLPLKVKRKQHHKGHPQHSRLYGQSIEARQGIINQRKEFERREIDIVVGRKSTRVVPLATDVRITRYRHIKKIANKNMQAVEQGLNILRVLYGKRFGQIFRFIANDNGSEFASLQALLPELSVYYAQPYSTYERGLNEKQNSLIRRFLPKGCSFEDVSDNIIQEIQN